MRNKMAKTQKLLSLRVLPLFVAAMGQLFCFSMAEGAELKTDEYKVLYALGHRISKHLVPFDLTPAELEILQAGLADGVAVRAPKVDLDVYDKKIEELENARTMSVAAREKKLGETYARKLARDRNSIVTEAGVVYTPIREGKGISPTERHAVTIHYHGTLIDGAVFHSTMQKGEPEVYHLETSMPCWKQALPLMKVGGKARLVCPSDTAYGDYGHRPEIPPGATLTFDMELVAANESQLKPDQ